MECIFATRNFIGLSEFIPNQLYFTMCRNIPCSRDVICNEEVAFFTVDDELVYENYFGDFGPLNIYCLYKFCEKLLDLLGHYGTQCFYNLYENSIFYDSCVSKRLADKFTRPKAIVFYTRTNNEKRANAAFLIGCFAVLYLGYSPCLVNRILSTNVLTFRHFQDAVVGLSPITITLKDCFGAVFNAAVFGFFDFNDFNYEEYKYYDNKKHGHVNWILPGKLVALPGPIKCCPDKDPMCYVNYFKLRNVSDVIALTTTEYDPAFFENNGIRHHCMPICQGEVPDDCEIKTLFEIIECALGAVAIHCRAGLGRTGTVIAAYLMKHYKLCPKEAVAWVRICRPGSILGCQQLWLECKQSELEREGNEFRQTNYGDCDKILCHPQGIYNYCVPSLSGCCN